MDHVIFMDYTLKTKLEEFSVSADDLFSDVISMRSWTLISASIQKTSLHRSMLTNNRCLLATRSMKINLPPVCTATKQRMIPFTRHARATTKASSRACLAKSPVFVQRVRERSQRLVTSARARNTMKSLCKSDPSPPVTTRHLSSFSSWRDIASRAA